MIPTLAQLPGKPKRIILHWTAGAYKPNDVDLRSYHYVIDGDGKPHVGVPVANNMRRLTGVRTSEYAPHIAGWNSYSVGVSFAGMHGAQERGPWGKWPLTQEQVIAGCYFVGQLCRAWDLPVTPGTVHTHAEADWRHGVKQNGKWDINVFPWDPNLSREEVSAQLRRWVQMGKDMQDVTLRPVEFQPQPIKL
jgi:hypothetical protein